MRHYRGILIENFCVPVVGVCGYLLGHGRLEDHCVSIGMAEDTVSMLLIEVCTHCPVYVVS